MRWSYRHLPSSSVRVGRPPNALQLKSQIAEAMAIGSIRLFTPGFHLTNKICFGILFVLGCCFPCLRRCFKGTIKYLNFPPGPTPEGCFFGICKKHDSKYRIACQVRFYELCSEGFCPLMYKKPKRTNLHI